VAVIVKRNPEAAMRTRLVPRALVMLVVAIATTWWLAGCDDSIEIGGVGVSTGLPTTGVSDSAGAADIGVGSVHWVGNPRW
jgi:hypothetical protein